MRILALVTLTTICAGCIPAGGADRAVLSRLSAAATPHAAALAGDDVPAMRRTGRALIAQIDAAAGTAHR